MCMYMHFVFAGPREARRGSQVLTIGVAGRCKTPDVRAVNQNHVLGGVTNSLNC